MKPSEFLRFAAEQIDLGRRIGPVEAKGWNEYICMTLPPVDDWNEREISETRVMRFLLAAEIARADGN